MVHKSFTNLTENSSAFRQSPLSRLFKRAFDIAAASTGLALFALPMAVVAVAVRRHDGGPILYRQTRVGRDRQTFEILKFRSMIVNADAIGGYSTISGDPRITPIGHFIRRTSLDELPQLLNVLRGDMSIVGPRPDVPAQQANYTAQQWRLRHEVRPGITGLAQAVARSTATPKERTELDLTYVRSTSLLFDLKIIAMTFRQLLSKTSN